jgi:hypothetical protein
MVTRAEVLALFGDFDDEKQPRVISREYFYVPAPSRDGTATARERVGGVFIHIPTVAVLLPSDLPALSQRRPDLASLRHVLVRFSFMLDRLPARHAYKSVTFTVTLDHPDAVVRLMRPAWVTVGSESTSVVTTELSAAVDILAKLGAQRTTVKGVTRHGDQPPVVSAEKRTERDFGWRHEAREGAPLVPRIEYGRAVIELPRDVTELAGRLSAEAVIEVPRWGVLTASRTLPADSLVPFWLPLGTLPA